MLRDDELHRVCLVEVIAECARCAGSGADGFDKCDYCSGGTVREEVTVAQLHTLINNHTLEQLRLRGG